MPFKGTDKKAYARAGREGKTPAEKKRLYAKYSGKEGSNDSKSKSPRSSFSDRQYTPPPRRTHEPGSKFQRSQRYGGSTNLTPPSPLANSATISKPAHPPKQPKTTTNTQTPKPQNRVIETKEFVGKRKLLGDKANFTNTVFDAAKNSVRDFVLDAARDLAIDVARSAAKHILKELFPVHIIEKIDKTISFVETVREFIQLGESVYEIIVEIEKKGRKLRTKTTKRLVNKGNTPKQSKVYRPTLENRNNERVISELRNVFAQNSDKRISVVGASCIGKTTLLRNLQGCIDGDDIVWAQIPKEVFIKLKSASEPWAEDIVDIFKGYAKSVIFEIKTGQPVFNCGVFNQGELDCDLIVYLNLKDDKYIERVTKRGKDPDTMLRHKAKVERAVRESGVPVITVSLD